MTIIELSNHNQLPSSPLVGYILLSPEDAATEHRRKYGAVNEVYRVTRGKKVTLYIAKGLEDETRKAETQAAHQGTP